MTVLSSCAARTVAALALALAAPAALPSGGEPSDAERRPAEDRELGEARRAVEAKRWPEAVALLQKVAARDARNADVQNLLGYAERSRGNLDAAFGHYATALRLDPKHRGAHEYVGEAYLLVGNLAKAKEHLATLDKLCRFSCEEYRDLKKAIAAYERQHASSR